MARVLPGKMGKSLPFLALALAAPLTGCGDGGGVASTNEPNTPPSPPPSPPTTIWSEPW
ncbi:hypothetical protein ACFS32_19045 [Novosphingobium pokkalii]|uniref:hypothetical protein n=1 Tax=Novosphingobium pokkalii TaxID=1770194 RepID=UPI003626005C